MALLTPLFTLLLAVGVSHGQCPAREDILPCTCTADRFDNSKIKVFCSRVDDVDDVRRALQSAKRNPELIVEFDNSRLGSVPSDLFAGLNITQVYFHNCVLKRLGDEGRSALEGLEDIVKKLSLEFSFPKANPLTFLNVSRLRALTYLQIRFNNVKEVEDDWFAEGPANLKQLYFNRNKITRLGDRAFAQLTNIMELSLAFNKIKSVKRSMFPSPAARLITIRLSENEISILPNDLFSNMPKLETVLLDQNSIKLIPEATWSHTWSRLNRLELIGNPLICDADIEWIFEERRPKTLKARCASPPTRRGESLDYLIDREQRD